LPTILREDGFVVRVFGPPREHPPPHVHVECGREAVVIIRLGSARHSPSVRAVYRMHARDIAAALALIERHHGELVLAWREIHGEADDD